MCCSPKRGTSTKCRCRVTGVSAARPNPQYFDQSSANDPQQHAFDQEVEDAAIDAELMDLDTDDQNQRRWKRLKRRKLNVERSQRRQTQEQLRPL